jgi:hypothetical protein
MPTFSMTEEIYKHRVHPNVPFTTVLDSPLPFKIPVTLAARAKAHPSELVWGMAEYDNAVDSWLSDFIPSLGFSSETSVTASDIHWQGILGKLCDLKLCLNQKDPSSQIKLRPDFTGLYKDMLVIKGEAKNDSIEISNAISELIDKFHDTAHLMFPSYSPIIPGVASSRQTISLHRIYYDNHSQCYCQDFVKQYRVLDLAGRLRFIVDIFKIAIWIVSQTSPTQYFHLVTNVRIKTRNSHHVTLVKEGIVKEFYHQSAHLIPMQIIKNIYHAKLPNVEQGIANCTTVTITTVGRRLRDVIRRGGLEKSVAFTQVEEAVRQLHDIGIAHCDICVDNVFVNVVDDVVFLGDLEYCRPMLDPPPIGIRRADLKAKTAEELDHLQLGKLKDELALL